MVLENKAALVRTYCELEVLLESLLTMYIEKFCTNSISNQLLPILIECNEAEKQYLT
jgi:hypothetical protein